MFVISLLLLLWIHVLNVFIIHPGGIHSALATEQQESEYSAEEWRKKNNNSNIELYWVIPLYRLANTNTTHSLDLFRENYMSFPACKIKTHRRRKNWWYHLGGWQRRQQKRNRYDISLFPHNFRNHSFCATANYMDICSSILLLSSIFRALNSILPWWPINKWLYLSSDGTDWCGRFELFM